jgi:lysophospholipase L1-like esterase
MVAILLALEVFAHLQIISIALLNPYYLASHGKEGEWPPKVPDPAQFPLLVSAKPLSWSATAPKSPMAADWGMPQRDGDDARKRARRMMFSQLSEADRIWFALGAGEIVLSYDHEGRLRDVYGNAFRQYVVSRFLPQSPVASVLADSVRNTARSNEAQTIRINLDPDGRAIGITDLFFLPAQDARLVYIFFDLEYKQLLLDNPDIPDTSRWEILDFSYKKNIKGTVPDTPRLNTNSYGFRGPDVAVPKPKGVVRILCIGGSTTYEGSDDSYTYPALLEEQLRARFPGRQIEVVNCGVEGLRTRNQFLHLPAYFELEPDLIIGYLGVNDIQHDVQEVVIYDSPTWMRLAFKSTFFRYNLSWVFRPSDDVLRQWLRNLTITNIEGLRRITARKGIRFALCSLAYAPYDSCTWQKRQFLDTTCDISAGIFAKLASLLNEEIRGYCNENGLLYIPIAENITDSDYLIDTCHLSDPGIALKAKIIFHAIADYVAPAVQAR